MNQEFADIVKKRRAVRGFLPDPVPQQTLESIFELAQQAPSNCNTQPWKVAVVSGKACDDLREKFMHTIASGEMQMDFPYEGKYDGEYRQRQHGAASALYTVLGIPREDKLGRNIQFMENFRFFGAPHVAFIFIPAEFGIREACDVGMYAQNLMLSMTAEGIASCPQTALSFCSGLVRDELGIDDSLKLLFGISFGYEDTSNKVNLCKTDRASVEDTVTFYGENS